MKVALVCDDLIQQGGHERVIMDFCEMFPDAPLYAIAASKKWQQICKEKNIELIISFVQKLPFIEQLSRYYAPFMFHILGIQSFDFSKYDLVISLSSRFAHGAITKPQTLHICYMSTPGRMFWESAVYFKEETYGLLAPLKRFAQSFLAIPLSLIRLWDFTAAQRVDYFLCNSQTTKRRVAKYYKRDAKIIYPAIDISKFSELTTQNKGYFLVITRLVSWKRVDIAIEACMKTGQKLKIIGAGPDEARLKELAKNAKNIEFLGYVSEDQKLEELENCSALINTQMEDFGIVPLEAMAAGKPVLAYGAGGVLETVISGLTGDCFEEQTMDSLQSLLLSFKSENYKSADCRAQAKKFDTKLFYDLVNKFINGVYFTA